MSESRSLLRSSGGGGGGSGRSSAPGSASHTPLSHPIKLEDHRPGRPTTFSLLVGSTSSPPRSPELRGYDAFGSSSALAARTADSTAEGINGTPYKFGDGTTGYRILFPTPEEDEEASSSEDVQRHVSIAIWLSLIINILLFVAKTFSAIVSHSLSVAASAVDSFLDLASQAIVFLAERGSKDHDSSLYPAGRSRLEPVGIILCAALMGMAALQLILESSQQLYEGYTGKHVDALVTFDTFTLSLLVLTIVAKLGLWIYCAAYAKYSPTLYTLAIDHRNDVLSNVVALIAAMLAWMWSSAWSADPIGAIIMSIYICANWFTIGNEQIEMIVGRAADPEFIESIRTLASNFHTEMVPDIIRAYHFGANYLVELEVILPAQMVTKTHTHPRCTVREAHDISLALQQSVEQLPLVERAFVHVDYQSRDNEDEHDAKLIAEKERANSLTN